MDLELVLRALDEKRGRLRRAKRKAAEFNLPAASLDYLQRKVDALTAVMEALEEV